MIVHNIQDSNGVTASAHINPQGEAVLVVEKINDDYNFGIFTFESIEEIDFLISRLNELKEKFDG